MNKWQLYFCFFESIAFSLLLCYSCFKQMVSDFLTEILSEFSFFCSGNSCLYISFCFSYNKQEIENQAILQSCDMSVVVEEYAKKYVKDIVREMIAIDLDDASIQKVTKLTLDEILSIRKEMKE